MTYRVLESTRKTRTYWPTAESYQSDIPGILGGHRDSGSTLAVPSDHLKVAMSYSAKTHSESTQPGHLK